MTTRFNQGGASALPIARAFLATGGRILVTPNGSLEAQPNLERLLMTDDARACRAAWTIGRRFFRRLRDRRFAACVKALALIIATASAAAAIAFAIKAGQCLDDPNTLARIRGIARSAHVRAAETDATRAASMAAIQAFEAE